VDKSDRNPPSLITKALDSLHELGAYKDRAFYRHIGKQRETFAGTGLNRIEGS
jgi:hypothetical protein